MYKLYWAPRTAAFAPQAVMEEAGAAYETVVVDLAKGEQNSPAYLALNPGGTVPTLVTEEGLVLTESAAIMLWLAERHPETGLLPAPGSPERAVFWRWLFFLTNIVQSAYRRYYYSQRHTSDESGAPQVKAKARIDLLAGWQAVDQHLAESGPFLTGEEAGAADIYLLMLATWFDPGEELLAACPAVARCTAALSERPAIRRTLEACGYV